MLRSDVMPPLKITFICLSCYYLIGCYLHANITSLNSLSTDGYNSPKFTDSLSYQPPLESYKGENFTLSLQSSSELLKNFSIYPDLPKGLILNTSNGTIHGIPTEAKSLQSYTITATDNYSSFSTTVSFSIGLKFTVNTNADTSDLTTGDGACSDSTNYCSLRAAVEELNTWSDIPRQVLIPAMTITLNGSNITITKPMKLLGNSSTSTIISIGGSAIRHLDINLALNIDNVYLDNIGFQDGKPNTNGGSIIVSKGSLIISNSKFNNNQALSGGFGGAIYATNGCKNLSVINSAFDANSAPNITSRGGAIYLAGNDGITSIENSSFTNNSSIRNGGAIYSAGSTNHNLVILNSLFENNSSGNRNGGVYIDNGGFSIKNSVFNENIGAFGQLYLNTTCANTELCEITQSTFYTNSATALNAISIDTAENLIIVNSTLVGGDSGLGATIEYINAATPPVLTIKNSIISNLNGGSSCYSISTISLGYNISSAADCNFNQSSDQTNQSHISIFSTGVLTSLGGNQKVIEIKNPGPAIDKGPADCNEISDLRGASFLRPVNKILGLFCDVGAFEAQ